MATSSLTTVLSLRTAPQQSDSSNSKFTEAALERHKREGMELAVKARWAALAVIAVMLPLINPQLEVLYFEALVLAFALIAWGQLRVARVGRSWAELLLLFCDLALMTVVIVVPNPFSTTDWPLAMEYRGQGFQYFYVLLASSTMAYSWRTIRGMGTVTTGLWLFALGVVWFVSDGDPALTDAAYATFGHKPVLAEFMDPNNPLFYIRVQEVVVFLIVATTLALTVRRYGDLLMGHAALERERANLGRYFSPNVVEELSQNDEPLKQIRTRDIAVLFVDIVGFTRYAADRTPQDVIETLRQFHQRMEDEVFRHGGTLDKYLGDGLMATFGTPVAGDADALNALRCGQAMVQSVAAWNAERAAKGEPPIQVGVGLHYGPAVLGDIGANRLEFAVIGNTVNVASRIEALTRDLSVKLAASDDLLARARSEAAGDDETFADLARHDGLEIRGLDTRMTLWALP